MRNLTFLLGYPTNYNIDIVMLRINYRKQRMSWKNIRKSYKKVLTFGYDNGYQGEKDRAGEGGHDNGYRGERDRVGEGGHDNGYLREGHGRGRR